MSDAKSKSAAQKARFLAVWPKIKSELVAHLESNGMPEDICAWFGKVGLYMSLSWRVFN
jgi:hypothetical protein